MGLAVVVLVGAVAVGWVSGGTFAALAAFPLRAKFLVAAAVALQVAGGLSAWTADTAWPYVAGIAASAALVLGFCARNLRLPGVPLVTLGLLANAVVVGLSGAMPVSTAAAARADVSVTSIAAGSDPRHVLAHAGTPLRMLGDVVPVPLPVHPEVASPGDVLVCAGLAELVVVAMRGRWRRRRAQPPEAQSAGFDGQASQALVTMSRRS